MKVLLSCILFFFYPLYILAQDKNEIILQRVEFISEQLEDEEIDLTGIFENLENYYNNKLNLNTATEEELNLLGLLTEIQVANLLNHRESFGKLISIYELQSLKFWNLFTIQNVLPFVKVTDRLDQVSVGFRELLKQGKGELFLRYQRILENKSGYQKVPDSLQNKSNSFYRGSADKVYSRFRFSYKNNLSLGFTAEKDAGEEFFKGSNKYGFDFYSAHAYYNGGKYLRTLTVGDYQMQIGQGISFWTGNAFGKSADIVSVKKNARGLRPYTSVDEARFLRGAGVELGVKNISLTLFASRKSMDATLVSDNTNAVSSINLSGLHRTNSELLKKRSVKESIFGSYLKYNSRKIKVGLSAISLAYDKALEKTHRAYNKYDFKGRGLTNLGADYSWVFKNFNAFGEIGYSTSSNAVSILQGLIIAIDSKASLSFLYRKYPKNYHTFYAQGFAEGSKTQNETGFFSGATLKLSKSWKLNTYLDIFTFPWLKYQVNSTSNGYEFLSQLTHKPNKRSFLYFRYREQVKQKNRKDVLDDVVSVEDVIQRNFRVNYSYKLSASLKWKSRLEIVTVDRLSIDSEKGVLLMQDLVFRPKAFPLDLTLRYAMFDTDSYDARIYAYENNALYVFSIPAYYYQGSRAYILTKYTFAKRCDLWLRYGVSVFANRKSIGSGPEEINNNTKSDITFQLRLKF